MPGLDPGIQAVFRTNRGEATGMDRHPGPASPARAQAQVKPGDDDTEGVSAT